MEHTVSAFIEYLKEQVGQPYLWGGQHTRLTPENYVRVIERKEAGRGKYPDGTTYFLNTDCVKSRTITFNGQSMTLAPKEMKQRDGGGR